VRLIRQQQAGSYVGRQAGATACMQVARKGTRQQKGDSMKPTW
jgi:hypothetical protein